MPDNQHSRFGPIRAVILDWAGTTVDHGSLIPAQAFVEAFAHFGVEVTLAEARAPMGQSKRAHIKAMTAMPRVASLWRQEHGTDPTDADVDALYNNYLPQLLQHAVRSEVIEGIPETIAVLRRQGLGIGSTTGYPREVMDIIAPHAAKAGYAPDHIVTASDVAHGRPAPWMLLENARRLNAWPLSCVVKADDTIAGIKAGLAARCWTVGVVQTGNTIGLSVAELQALSPEDQQQRLDAAHYRLQQSGAHYTVDSVVELPGVLIDIEERLARGEQP